MASISAKVDELARLEIDIRIMSARKEQLRAELMDTMRKEHIDKAGAYDGDTRIATVTLSPGNVTARLTDEKAAIEWIAQHHPGELEDVVVINTAYQRKLLEFAKANGRPGEFGVDPDDREVGLPFIEITRGAAYVKVEYNEDGQERIKASAQAFGVTEA